MDAPARQGPPDRSARAGDPGSATVHLLRHGEVENPEGVLYGRLPGYHLSELGVRMAERAAEHLLGGGHDVARVVSSPLERAQQTAAPVAGGYGLQVETDARLIEAGNHFQGLTFGVGEGVLWHPRHWWHLRNPFRPSWGEAYEIIAARMLAATAEVAASVPGREAVCVSHQLPVWTARRRSEGRRLWHDPRERECALASLTSLRFALDGEHPQVVAVGYAEPAADLLPAASKVAGA